MTLNNKKGFTLIELLIAIAIISIVVVVAVPRFFQFQNRAYDANVQANLRSVFTACQDFWTFNSSNNPCVLTTVSNTESGFIPSPDVEVTIDSNGNNTVYDFYATASHKSSSNIFVIDYRGAVSKANGGDGQNGGNNDQGCSEEAQNNPQNLGQNAAGGCGTNDGNNDGSNDGSDGWWKQWWQQWWKQWRQQ